MTCLAYSQHVALAVRAVCEMCLLARCVSWIFSSCFVRVCCQLCNPILQGTLRGYGAARLVPRRDYALAELKLNGIEAEKLLSPTESTISGGDVGTLFVQLCLLLLFVFSTW